MIPSAVKNAVLSCIFESAITYTEVFANIRITAKNKLVILHNFFIFTFLSNFVTL